MSLENVRLNLEITVVIYRGYVAFKVAQSIMNTSHKSKEAKAANKSQEKVMHSSILVQKVSDQAAITASVIIYGIQLFIWVY